MLLLLPTVKRINVTEINPKVIYIGKTRPITIYVLALKEYISREADKVYMLQKWFLKEYILGKQTLEENILGKRTLKEYISGKQTLQEYMLER